MRCTAGAVEETEGTEKTEEWVKNSHQYSIAVSRTTNDRILCSTNTISAAEMGIHYAYDLGLFSTTVLP